MRGNDKFLLDIFQVCSKHFQNYFDFPFEQQRIFSHEKIAAFAAQARYRNAPAASADFSVFDYDALMARRGECASDKIRKCVFKVENRHTFVHHARYRVAAALLFSF